MLFVIRERWFSWLSLFQDDALAGEDDDDGFDDGDGGDHDGAGYIMGSCLLSIAHSLMLSRAIHDHRFRR